MDNQKGEIHIICQSECPTCQMILPVIREIADEKLNLTIYTQDHTAFLKGLTGVVDDSSLVHTSQLGVDIVPTMIIVKNGAEVCRCEGWDKSKWQSLTGMPNLGRVLPEKVQGCGSRRVQLGSGSLISNFIGNSGITSRRFETEDEVETCFEMGWTDGLPVVPPTEGRIVRMLSGTHRKPEDVIGKIPPKQSTCSVEKVAINAVMAGCLPQYFPIVIAAVEAALMDQFCLHGLVATTYFSGPVVIVNGPVVKTVGINSGINAFGQGNRANATIGRALQLVVQNVGGGRPGEIDRATFGTPGKYSFCFAEDESGSPWEPLSVERGFPKGTSTVTLFAGGGIQPIVDQRSRNPESLSRTYAACLKSVVHSKIPNTAEAILVVSPEHGSVFREAGWTKRRLYERLKILLQLSGADLVRGAHGIEEGIPKELESSTINKFSPGGLHIVHAGGSAGKFSAIINGWIASGTRGSQPVTREIQL